MFAIQLVDVKDVTMSPDAWPGGCSPSQIESLLVELMSSMAGPGVDTLVVEDADVVEGSSCCA